MKIGLTPLKRLDPDFDRLLKEVIGQINQLSEGTLAANYNALQAPPTSGAYAKGDEVKNSNPSELGAIGSKYVIRGWQCIASGTPGTWVQQRYLTGN
jgi:hypothetical protein